MTNPPRGDAPELRVTLMPSEAQLIETGKALASALEYLRGESPGVTSGGHRNGALRNQIKWVLLGCDGPLRADTPARAGMVKPLVWEDVQLEGGDVSQHAKTSIGKYAASDDGWFIIGMTTWFDAAGIEAAKAAAQADYETRILAALTPAPAAQDPVAWRYRSIDKPTGWTSVTELRRSEHARIGMEEQPLYATPPAAPTDTALVEALEECRDELDAWVSHRDDLIRSGYDVDHSAAVSSRATAALASRAAPPEGQHPDDIAVNRFAYAMKIKLSRKRAEGRGGWEGPTCSAELLSQLLREHVEKGDPVDVGNLAMMLHQRGERIITGTNPPEAQVTVADRDCAYEAFEKAQTVVHEGGHIHVNATYKLSFWAGWDAALRALAGGEA